MDFGGAEYCWSRDRRCKLRDVRHPYVADWRHTMRGLSPVFIFGRRTPLPLNLRNDLFTPKLAEPWVVRQCEIELETFVRIDVDKSSL
jgi:hypothetical protein